MAEKKYYWMRLKPTFFTSKEIKKLRKIAGGDTYIIIYLKMQLLSLETGGKLYYDGIEDDFADEIALELDEDADNVRMTLAYLEKCGLIEQRTDDEYYLPEVSENTGSETAAAMRMRKSRNRNNVTIECNNVTPMLHNRYTEKEKEKEIEIDIEKETEVSKGETDVSPPPTKTKRFIKPSLDEVRSYCQERHNNVDAERFIDYYESNGWKVGKNPMKDWKAAVRTWERRSYNEPIQQPAPNIADIPDEELSEMDRIYKKLRC